LPGFCNPRSIILTSSMTPSFPNFRNHSNSEYPKSSLTLISENRKLREQNGKRGWTTCKLTGQRSIQRRCANILPAVCRFRQSPRRSTRGSTQYIPGTRRSVAPSAWGFPALTRPKNCRRVGPGGVGEKRRAWTSRASGTLLNLLREYLCSNKRRRRNSAVSNSCRAIFRFSISKRAIAVTLMAAKRMEKRSRSAAILGGRTQATARRISI